MVAGKPLKEVTISSGEFLDQSGSLARYGLQQQVRRRQTDELCRGMAANNVAPRFPGHNTVMFSLQIK